MKYKIASILFFIILIVFGQNKDNLKLSTSVPNDTVKEVNTKGSKLEAPLLSKADDSIWHDFSAKKTYIINKANVKYKSDDITSGRIVIDWNTNEIAAYGVADSLGKITQKPKITQNGKPIEADAIKFNMKTKKGIIYGLKTEEGEGVIYGKKVKNHSDSLAFVKDGWFTTDPLYKAEKDSIPDYFISADRIKWYKDDKIITGPAQMYIENIPTPLVMPFGYFPTSTAKSMSGILIPSWGEQADRGFFMQGLGYYWAINDYLDAKLTADIYTKGSWAVDYNTNYKKRYKFSGNLNFHYENIIQGVKGLEDYSKNKVYRIRWSHRQDQKANPNLTFQSSVNFSSSRLYRDSFSQQFISNSQYLTNTINSSITLMKKFDNLPINMTLSASHNQNTNTEIVNLILPKLTVNMARQYPFASKSGAKKGLLQNIGVDYNFNTEFRLNGTEDEIFQNPFFKTAKTGFDHNFNVSTSTNILKHFNLSFGGAYNETWYLSSLKKEYNSLLNEVVETEIDGFITYRDYSFNTSLNTTLFKLMKFKKGKIAAIRHMVRPTVSYNYVPDFGTEKFGYYDYYTNEFGEQVSYARHEGGIYGGPSSGEVSSFNLGLSNNLEAKIRTENDSLDFKKIKLIDQFNINTGYNMAADSLKWSPVSMNGSTSILNSKMRINFGGTVEVYNYDKHAKSLTNEFGNFKLSQFRANLNYELNNKTFERKSDKAKKTKSRYRGNHRYEDFEFDKDGYSRFTIPWNFRPSINYTKNLLTDSESFRLNFTGDVELSPHWKVGVNSGYDFVNKEFTDTRFTFQRDLRSFNINFQWVPFGSRRSYFFFIGIKANILKDLKYDQRQFNESRPLF